MCPPINPHVHYRYGISQMQGRRPYMEDRHSAMADLNGDSTQSFYAIFDGHGGDGAAKCVAEVDAAAAVAGAALLTVVLQLLRAGHVPERHPGADDQQGARGSAQERIPAHGSGG
ncbi:unnamed protein product [Phytophthora fragariaefolia]|uniref:Unnamed protein product n=1 Tax=Phytophthora fragariaefolia TaxID=1490495 RepID=A0A9W6X667_9STRA|nr:unnamed protein product [Phytophthora fragariaefolia]